MPSSVGNVVDMVPYSGTDWVHTLCSGLHPVLSMVQPTLHATCVEAVAHELRLVESHYR